MQPSTNGDNGGGRGPSGRFAKGNRGGPGNPHARRVARLRSILLKTVTEDDLQGIVAMLVQKAKDGDLAAAREVLNRLVGKPDYGPDPDRVGLDGLKLKAEKHDAERASFLAGT